MNKRSIKNIYLFRVVIYSNEKYYSKQTHYKRILLKKKNKKKEYASNCYHLEYKKEKAKVYYKKQI